jgi:hypothetical protein
MNEHDWRSYNTHTHHGQNHDTQGRTKHGNPSHVRASTDPYYGNFSSPLQNDIIPYSGHDFEAPSPQFFQYEPSQEENIRDTYGYQPDYRQEQWSQPAQPPRGETEDEQNSIKSQSYTTRQSEDSNSASVSLCHVLYGNGLTVYRRPERKSKSGRVEFNLLDVPFDGMERELSHSVKVDQAPIHPSSLQLSPLFIDKDHLERLNVIYGQRRWIEFSTPIQTAVIKLLAERLHIKIESIKSTASKKINWDMVRQLLSGDENKVLDAIDKYKNKKKCPWETELSQRQREEVLRKVVQTYNLLGTRHAYDFLAVRSVTALDGALLLQAKTRRDVVNVSKNWQRSYKGKWKAAKDIDSL